MDFEKFGKQLKNNPRKTIQFVTGFVIVLLVLWVIVLFQAESLKEEKYVDMPKSSETAIFKTDKQRAEAVQADKLSGFRESSDTGFGSGSMAAFMILLLGGTGAWLFLTKRKKGGKGQPAESVSGFKILSKEQVSDTNSLVLAEVNGEYWMMSSGNEGLKILKTFSKVEWAACREVPKQESKNGKSFSDLLNGYRINGNA